MGIQQRGSHTWGGRKALWLKMVQGRCFSYIFGDLGSRKKDRIWLPRTPRSAKPAHAGLTSSDSVL